MYKRAQPAGGGVKTTGGVKKTHVTISMHVYTSGARDVCVTMCL